jgi:hypothetical protein
VLHTKTRKSAKTREENSQGKRLLHAVTLQGREGKLSCPRFLSRHIDQGVRGLRLDDVADHASLPQRFRLPQPDGVQPDVTRRRDMP